MKNMLKKSLFAVAALTLGATSLTANANVCKDDPRMFTIKTVLDKMDAGEAVDPLKLTPQTFLELTDNVREKLGDNIRVYNESCVPVQVFEGQIAKPIVMPYSTLEDSLHRAALRGDDKMVNLIFQQFRPTPVEDKELIGYVRPLTWTQDAIETLYRTGLMERVAVGTSNSHNTAFCSTIESPVSQLSLFASLGGKLNAPADLIVGSKHGDNWFMDTSGAAFSATPSVTFIKTTSDDPKSCAPISVPRLLNSFAKAGFSLLEYNKIFRDKDDALREYQRTQLAEAL